MKRRLSAFRLVMQEDDTGCGVACVAMLAGVSYAEAKRIVFGDRPRKQVFFMNSEDMRRALDGVGVGLGPMKHVRVGAKFKPDGDALVLVNVDPASTLADDNNHWILYRHGERRFYDPLKARPIGRPKRRIRLYLMVGKIVAGRGVEPWAVSSPPTVVDCTAQLPARSGARSRHPPRIAAFN